MFNRHIEISVAVLLVCALLVLWVFNSDVSKPSIVVDVHTADQLNSSQTTVQFNLSQTTVQFNLSQIRRLNTDQFNLSEHHDISNRHNVLHATSRKQHYWQFISPIHPSLYDAFARDSIFKAVFQSRTDQCSSCRCDGSTMLLDYHGVSKRPVWSCSFNESHSMRATVFVDPTGHAFVVTCPAPSVAVQKVTITAEVDDEPPLIYKDIEYHLYEPSEPELLLAGCTMIRPSITNMQLLLEWLAYHRLQGFEHFLLYSDGDPIPLRAALSIYMEQDFVDVVDWEWPTHGFHHQQAQMHSCLYRYRGLARWVALFDMDEYFQPMQNVTVAQLLQSKENIISTGLIVRMVLFMPNLDGLITQGSQVRGNTPLAAGERSKSIVRTKQVFAVSVHSITLATGPFSIADPVTELRLNHYRTGIDLPMASGLDSSMTKYGPALVVEMKHMIID